MSIVSILMVIISYLFGSISTAILVCRCMGLPDPRTQGSGNPGATNVLRIGGKLPAIITLVGDTCKAVIPVLIAKMLGFDQTTIALVLFAAFLGHLYPLFFNFAGGKGVATTFGGIIALHWPTGLCLIATWLLMAVIFRYSSLASLTAAILAPLYLWFFTNNLIWVGIVAIMTLLLILRHRHNIVKLFKGTESRITLRRFKQ